MNNMLRTAFRRLPAAPLIAVLLFPGLASPGGGPENVLVVVNGDSPISKRIANNYVELRDIPHEHVVWLHDIPYSDIISVGTFRKRIWEPIRDFIKRNGLDENIDIITYSASFPYRVNFAVDARDNKLQADKYRGRKASLTGLTYFARRVEVGDPHYLASNGNRYYRSNLVRRNHLRRSLTEEELKLHKKAAKAFKDEQFQSSVASYETLSRSYPEHGRIWYELSRGYAALGDRDRAMASLHQVVKQGWVISLETANDEQLELIHDHPDFQMLLMRMEEGIGPFQSAHRFSSRYQWTGAIRPVKSGSRESLDRYYLSTMLAYTGLNGNSVPEVEDYLSAAVSSDGTQPDGTVYLLENNNIRSRTRQPLFPGTLKALERREVRAEILSDDQEGQNGILPMGKDDVIGAVVGSAKFDWQSSGSRFLPGAIAESLTSYGGEFGNPSQTKLTEFLRHGAAGSSGAVAEPFSIQAKFPVPMIHVYYADGSSLAEAFYQSIRAPYQLIIIGDPLARPYAHFARVRLMSPEPDTAWSGMVRIQYSVTPAGDRPIGRVELWVDGRFVADARPGEPIAWDTRTVDDGYHEIRLVAVEAGRMQTRSYTRYEVRVANKDYHFTINPYSKKLVYGDEVVLSGIAPGGRKVSIWQGNRELASSPVKGDQWQVRFSSRLPGMGPVTLRARLMLKDGRTVRSEPIKLDVVGQQLIQALDQSAAQGAKGRVSGGKAGTVKLKGRLKQANNQNPVIVEGEFTVERSGFFQLVLTAAGRIRVDIDGESHLPTTLVSMDDTSFIPLALEEGRHVFRMELEPGTGKRPILRAVLEGDQVATVLSGKILKRPGSD